MLLLKALLVALAMARKHGGHGHGGRGGGRGQGGKDSACRGADKQALLDDLMPDLETGTMYCTLYAGYEQWPGCPVVDDVVDDVSPRRNLKDRKGGRKDEDYVKKNRARFTMSSGTSTFVQVEDNSQDDAQYQCYSDNELKFTVVPTTTAEPTLEQIGRRLLGKKKVATTVQVTQTGTCAISHTLTCSISRWGGLQANDDGTCEAVSISCGTGRDVDASVKMACYTTEEAANKGWEDVATCSATDAPTDAATTEAPTEESIVSLAVEP